MLFEVVWETLNQNEVKIHMQKPRQILENLKHLLLRKILIKIQETHNEAEKILE